MKKILALLMTVAMVGSLTACGGNADTPNTAESTETTETTQEAAGDTTAEETAGDDETYVVGV